MQTLRTRQAAHILHAPFAVGQVPLKRSSARLSRSEPIKKRRKFVKSSGGCSVGNHLGIQLDGPSERITRAGLRQLGLGDCRALNKENFEITCASTRSSSKRSVVGKKEKFNVESFDESHGAREVERRIESEVVAVHTELRSVTEMTDFAGLCFLSALCTDHPIETSR